jgi:hypothetical protein
VLDALRALAPVRAVRGNNDKGRWAANLPCSDVVEAGGQMLYVLHDVADLDLEPAAAGFAAVLSGHSHRPSIERRRGVLYLNPGSAGPRRFSLPIAVAKLTVSARRCDARHRGAAGVKAAALAGGVRAPSRCTLRRGLALRLGLPRRRHGGLRALREPCLAATPS